MTEQLTEERVRQIIAESGVPAALAKYLQKRFWSDVPPTDGQVEQWNTAKGRWIPATVTGGAALTVQEEDGTPIDTAVTIIRVPNTSLIDNGTGDVSLGYELAGAVTTHAGLADPHTGYRLESADHSHQSTGLQAGQLDHGLALTGLTDDDHSVYALLLGRATGQSQYGGNAANENYIIGGTSHATHTTSIISMLDHVRLASGKVIQDSGGNTRITLAASNPFIDLSGTSGGVRIEGSLGLLNTTPPTNGGDALAVVGELIVASGTYKTLNLNPTYAYSSGTGGTATAVSGVMPVKITAGGSHVVQGLDFQAQILGDLTYLTSGSTSTVTALRAMVARGAFVFVNMDPDVHTVNVTAATTASFLNPSITYINSGSTATTITNFFGVDIGAWTQSTTGFVVTTATQLRINALAGTSFTGNRFGIQIGDQSGNIASTKISYGIQMNAQDATAPSGAGGAVWALFYGDAGTPLATVGYKGDILSYAPTGTGSGANCGIGYGAGAGGTVTQLTSKSTGVTLNTVCGAITMHNASLAAATIVSFVLTDSAIAATDVLVLNHISGGTIGSYTLNAQCAAGSATINVRNNTAGALAEALVIQFAAVKGVNA